MVLSSIQPCFIPWLGYFEQIAVADIFVYLDDVQYTKKDWRNNNQLKSQYGTKDVYVPVKKTTHETLINQALISYNENWEKTLLNKITEWYKKAPYFEEVVALIEKTIHNKYEKLIDLNFNLNGEILKYLSISTPVFFSSSIHKNTDDKNQRIIEICKHFENIHILYDGKSAQNFIDLELFKTNGIDVIFQDYQHLPYPQLWHTNFTPYMSVIDLLMNCGKESKKIILNSPRPAELARI